MAQQTLPSPPPSSSTKKPQSDQPPRKHLFVAGGSRGIGRTTALLAAKVGASVSVNYLRNKDAAEAVVAQIRASGGRAVAVQANLAEDGEASRAVSKAIEVLGSLSGVVVSAGIFEPSPIGEMTADFWNRTMEINLRSTLSLYPRWGSVAPVCIPRKLCRARLDGYGHEP